MQTWSFTLNNIGGGITTDGEIVYGVPPIMKNWAGRSFEKFKYHILSQGGTLTLC